MVLLLTRNVTDGLLRALSAVLKAVATALVNGAQHGPHPGLQQAAAVPACGVLRLCLICVLQRCWHSSAQLPEAALCSFG